MAIVDINEKRNGPASREHPFSRLIRDLLCKGEVALSSLFYLSFSRVHDHYHLRLIIKLLL